MVLTASFVLSPAIRLSCHRRLQRSWLPELERQRRGVRTTRLLRPHRRCSSKAPPRPPHPVPTFVTMANAPPRGTGWQVYGLICDFGKSEYFFKWGWTSGANQPTEMIAGGACYFANRYAPPFSTERWNAGRACMRDSHALRFGYGASLSNTFAISPTKLIWISAPVSELPTKNSPALQRALDIAEMIGHFAVDARMQAASLLPSAGRHRG